MRKPAIGLDRASPAYDEGIIIVRQTRRI